MGGRTELATNDLGVHETAPSDLSAADAAALAPAYAVVTPARDEAEHVPRVAEALVAQLQRPREWIIVDDGSRDDTRQVAERYAAEHDWIRVVSVPETHGRRARGAPIVRAFEFGCMHLTGDSEIVVKLDADVHVPPHYFSWVSAVFARDPRAGVVGGVSYVHDGENWVQDGAAHHVNGVAKAYRATCLRDIGGLKPSMGWDSIDEYAARARGWRVHVLSELPILHFRRRGSRQPWYRARWEEGVGNHYMGYLWSWILVRTAFRMLVERPPILGGLVLFAAFATARITGAPMIDDPSARRELRREQWARLRALPRGGAPPPPARLPGGGPAFWAGSGGGA